MPITRIDPADFVFSNDSISTSCWRDENGNPIGDAENTPSWDSQDVNSIENYYIGNPANLQFSVVFASKNSPRSSLSRKTYGTIRNIVFGDKNAIFEWAGSEQVTFNVISISKNCLKSSLLPGSFRIGNYTDDSNINPPRILNCGRAYNIASGTTSPGGGFTYGYGSGIVAGLFLPDVGLLLVPDFDLSTFVLSTENLTPTNHVFIRARNTQYNYSTNPSFISGSSGNIIHRDWYQNPQTYITTVGLYNDNNELMATAKLPRPYNKNFNNELLIQVGLNF
jgi:hypothetical protein